jgi:hypothetical protein
MTSTRVILSRVALGGLLLADGCGYLRAANATPPVAPMEGQLTVTLRQAEREASASRFGMADRLLSDFADTHANLPEAVETSYWRAVFKLDPANQTASPRDAIALLDAYLASGTFVAHPASAASLRRGALALSRVATVAAAPAAAPASPAGRTDARPDARADDKSRDDEVQRLKEELAKANAELERIKKRLSQPNP